MANQNEAEKKAAEEKAAAEKAAADKKAADEKAEADRAKEAAAKARRGSYYVVGPGSVTHGGKMYAAGSRLKLTDEEALSLGESVSEGEPPPPPEEIEKRTAGKYVVAGPGTVTLEGKQREAGFVLELGEVEARRLGAAVKRAS